MLIGYYKDAPGIYFDERGDAVSEDLAAEAGHDVRSARIERMRSEKLAEARRQIEAEVAELEARISRDLGADGGIDLSQAPPGGYGIVHLGGLRYRVVDASGAVVSGAKSVTKEAAESLVRDLVAAADSASRASAPPAGE